MPRKHSGHSLAPGLLKLTANVTGESACSNKQNPDTCCRGRSQERNTNMAVNLFPYQLDKLWALVRSMIQGLHTHEAAIGVKQNTESAVAADFAAAQAAEATFQTGCDTKRTLTAAVSAANDDGLTFIAKAKRILSNSLGA